MGLVEDCRATAAGVGVVDALVVPGAQNLVLLAGDRVLRFPRKAADAARIEEIAARHQIACTLGLAPRPPVRAVAGPVGVAHLELARIDGTPLPDVLASGDVDLSVVAESLARNLAATRLVRAEQWPFAQRDWVGVWAELPRRARRFGGLLPAAALPRWLAAAEAAADVAASAPLGLLHGDLQGGNVLVGTDDSVTTVLDWDSALIGDPAMDTAAALHDFPAGVRAELVARHDWLAADDERFAAYRATWELQAALWQAGDRSAVSRGGM